MSGTRGQLSAFEDFIREQGVVGLAIGVVIGVAAKDAVDALVNGIINPLIGLVMPANNLAEATFEVGGGTFGWGLVASAVINLLVVAGVIFFVIKKLGLDKLDKSK